MKDATSTTSAGIAPESLDERSKRMVGTSVTDLLAERDALRATVAELAGALTDMLAHVNALAVVDHNHCDGTCPVKAARAALARVPA